MMMERLYDLAFQYRESKLWQHLYDSDIFAVRLQDGEIGYCCIMGTIGEYTALGLYVGAKGWDSYRTMLNVDDFFMSQQDMAQLLNAQDCLQCAFENKEELSPEEVKEVKKYARKLGFSLKGSNRFPQFLRFRPGFVPWHIVDETEQEYIALALEAALEVSRRLKTSDKKTLGILSIEDDDVVPLLVKDSDAWRWETTELPPPPPPEEPLAPIFKNEVLAAGIRKARKSGDWECAIVRIPAPVQDGDNPPYFPVMLLVTESEGGVILPVPPVQRIDDVEGMLNNLAYTLMKDKVFPAAFIPRDERTEALLKDFCQKTNILLEEVQETPALDEAEEHLVEHLMAGPDDEDYEETEEMFASMIEDLEDMNVEQLKMIPPFVISNLMELAASDPAFTIPPGLKAKLRKAFPSMR